MAFGEVWLEVAEGDAGFQGGAEGAGGNTAEGVSMGVGEEEAIAWDGPGRFGLKARESTGKARFFLA